MGIFDGANKHDVFIIDGARTPFLKSHNKPGPFSALELSVAACRPLLMRNNISSSDFDEVVVGNGSSAPDECNIARLLALRLGLDHSTPAHTVQRNCASGLQAIDTGRRSIADGYSNLVLVGGVETMSRAPLLFNEKMTVWFSTMAGSKSLASKLKSIMQLRPDMFSPVIALLKALKDPTLNISMGQTAENLCYRFGITKEEMDAFALSSHERLERAQDEGIFDDEMVTIYDKAGNFYDHDDGVRRGNSMEKLDRLKPVFDRKFGNITAGNSAQVTDGGSFMILASEIGLRNFGYRADAKILDVNWAGVDPAEMGLGPANSIAPLVKRNGLKCKDIGQWEINEAFAAQVLACVKALNDPEYCSTELGMDKEFGMIPFDKLNIHGGGISQGHPVGASGARITYHLAKTLMEKREQYGVASLCIGHGQGGSILLENTSL